MIPIINCKTPQGMRHKSGVNTESGPVKDLPHWGNAEEMERKIWKK